MSRKQPRKVSYATLYEEWLLKNSKVKEQLKSDEIDEARAHEFMSDALAARTGLGTSLQCALMNETHDIEALTELWNQTLWETDKDAASQVTHFLPLFKSLNDNKGLKMKNAAEDIEDTKSANIDAFFDDYPKCVRQDWEDSESDESDDDEERVQPQSKKMATAPASDERSALPSTQQRSDLAVVVEKVQPSQAESHFSYTEPAPMAAPQNPYGQQQPTFQAAPPPPLMHQQQRQQQQTVSSRYNTWEQNSNNASWDDFRSQQNPFQTARELAQVGGDNNNSQQQGNDYRSMNQQQQQQHHNPYARQPQQQEPQHIRAPNIPDSLKRKFQPPKRGAENANQQQQNQTVSTKKKAAILSNGGGSIARTNNSSNVEEDDELPEALKGLDKELIEKIQNEIMEAGESVSFDDIAGLADAKQTVRELVCWPMKRPDLFTGLRRGPNGLLLFGPPGTGKTLIGKAIAFESQATFFSISSSSLTSKWIGEGEKLVRTLFAVAAYREPAVVFIDEIDSLLTQRKADENEASRRIKTEFLVQLDGTGTSGQGRVLVIGATNRPHELDDAARRRFVKRLYVPLPAQEDREILLRTLLKSNHHILEDKCFSKLSKDTDGFSGADLKALCNDAAMGPIRQLGAHALEVDANDVPPISYKHFRQALKGMHPSVAQADLDVYIEWNKTYGNKSMAIYNDEEDDSDSDA